MAEDVFIMPYSLICSVGGKIKIGKYSQIGMFSRVASQANVEIGNNVITGPNVFIADYNHEYKDPYKPIMYQGTRVNRKNIGSEPILTIGEGTWIGTNVVIVGTVSIGRNCVIGANSVVVNNIPDFSVAVGNPCKVIKQYDFKRKEWVKVK